MGKGMDMEDNNQETPEEEASDALSGPSTDGLADLFLELVQWVGRGGRDRLGQGARASKRAMERHQAKKDVERLYQKLGRETIRLIEAGEISHPGLEARLPRIEQEQQRLRLLTEKMHTEE